MDTVSGHAVATGVYRFETTRVNWYLVEGDSGLTVVDAGLPAHWHQLVEGVERLDYRFSDIEAILVTHGDLDHISFAEWLHQATDAPVWIHPADVKRANTVSRSLPPIGFLKALWKPPAFAYFVEVLQSGVGSVPPVTAFETFEDGDELDVPGHPTVIHVRPWSHRRLISPWSGAESQVPS